MNQDKCAGKNCPVGKICNPKTGRCVKRTGAIGRKLLAKSKSRRSRSVKKRKSRSKSKSRRSKSKSKSRRSKSKSKSRRSRKMKSKSKSVRRKSKSVRKSKTKSKSRSNQLHQMRSKLGEQLVKEYEASPKLTQSGRQGKEGLTVVMTASNGKRYAIKTFNAKKSLKRVAKEAELQNRVYNGGKVTAQVYAFGKSSVNGRPFIIMDAFNDTLEDWVKKRQKIKDRKREVFVLSEKMQKSILNAYKTMDKLDILHNDPKLDNLMVGSDGNVYIIDFGMSKFLTPSIRKAKAKKGASYGNNPNMRYGMLRLFQNICQYSISAPILYREVQKIAKEVPETYKRFNIDYYYNKNILGK